jgi:hypothetical protein
MKIKVNPHKLEIEKSPVNEKEINITKCEFEFSEEITNDYVKEAYFTLKDNTYKQIITNDQCDIPSEVLEEKGQIEIGVVAFLVENEEEIKRYNPSPVYIDTWKGSLKNAENAEPITPSDKEQIEQQLLNISTQMDNIDIEAEKVDHTTTVTITRKDGTSYDVEILDGEKGDKGDKGDAGAIKMIIVNELPSTGQDDTIYLVPLEEPESQENRYAEYVWVNNQWELLGKIGIEVDLTDYYTKGETNTLLNDKVGFTDYATYNKSGVIKVDGTYGGNVNANGTLIATNDSYATYGNRSVSAFIGKGTLENVITGKDLTTKAYVDGLVGDINTALDLLNGEVI